MSNIIPLKIPSGRPLSRMKFTRFPSNETDNKGRSELIIKIAQEEKKITANNSLKRMTIFLIVLGSYINQIPQLIYQNYLNKSIGVSLIEV